MMYQIITNAVNQRMVIVTPTPFLKVLASCNVALLPPTRVIICVLIDTPVEIIAGKMIRTRAIANENI